MTASKPATNNIHKIWKHQLQKISAGDRRQGKFPFNLQHNRVEELQSLKTSLKRSALLSLVAAAFSEPMALPPS